jgi:hypothetical protein
VERGQGEGVAAVSVDSFEDTNDEPEPEHIDMGPHEETPTDRGDDIRDKVLDRMSEL